MLKTNLLMGDTGHTTAHNEIDRRLVRVDDYTTIQGAIDDIAITGGRVEFGSGTYSAKGLILPQNVILCGQGMGATILNDTDATTDCIIFDTSKAGYGYASIRDMSLYGASSGSSCGIKIERNAVNNVSSRGHISVENVEIRNFGYGVYLINPMAVWLRNMRVSSQVFDSFYSIQSGSYCGATGVHYDNCQSIVASQNGFHFVDSHNAISLTSCYSDNCGKYGILIEPSNPLSAVPSNGFWIDGLVVESLVAYPAIYATRMYDSSISNLIVWQTAGLASDIIQLTDSRRVMLSNIITNITPAGGYAALFVEEVNGTTEENVFIRCKFANRRFTGSGYGATWVGCFDASGSALG